MQNEDYGRSNQPLGSEDLDLAQFADDFALAHAQMGAPGDLIAVP